ncbi:uncharacterized protein EDB93DRAFT_1108877 [Suillus bovinus]|uniref:uncharacterized protein n=1 Tax=Suillus bovinus TaxID=48563 RepID=UPI001B8758A3|nr:uncharacterized protein EDB93DRAFT_1257453 [Suillus bovinus]XP_041301506.1 uncharacterized protein EDB93DRAFT_1108877 [Suillus bovinus]KAG2126632.1 hypothetical protein EDB93DRAFT_1257453 [Suillus bovinus]KAG2128920.1 hypothetical protein EDB93DRAFT_1108877 [Suillus bovinus]
MSHPSNRPYQAKVQFESPMEMDESSYSSEAGMLVNVGGPRFNFSMSLPIAQPPMAPRFNFGMDLDIGAAPSAAPPTPWFNFGMNLSIPAAIPPSSPALPTPKPFNLGFALPLSAQPAPKPFNLGFNLLVQSMGTPALAPSPPTTKPFNLGFNVPMAVTPPTTRTGAGPGRYKASFRFECEPPSPIGEWQSELIRVPQPSPYVALLCVGSLPAIPDAAPGPSISLVLPHTSGHLDWPTLKSLVGDAERAAIDVLNRLCGEEFDHLAQMMVGSALGPGDDVWDPKPDEVLESNRMMLMAFCESRDVLTRIFKDLISLHHLAQVHERVLPVVESLLDEVDQAEAQPGEEM